MKKIIMFVSIVCLIGCQSYNGFNVVDKSYQIENVHRGSAASVVLDLGLEIEKMTSKNMFTKWEMLYDAENEYISRIVVDFENSIVKGHCLQRRTVRRAWERERAAWIFKRCTNRAALDYVIRNVSETAGGLKAQINGK